MDKNFRLSVTETFITKVQLINTIIIILVVPE